MRKIIYDICGNDIKDGYEYQFELYPIDDFRYSGRKSVMRNDICGDCANDLFNYIDTMRKTTRVKLST